MGYTNYTTNKRLPQFVDDDKPSWLGDVNVAFKKIDDAFTTNESSLANQQAEIATLQSQITILKNAIIANGGTVNGI
jgi:hypothetical protein